MITLKILSFRTESRTVASVILLWAIVLFSSSPVFLAHGLINGQCVFKSGQPLPSPLSSLTWHQVTYQVIFGTKQCQKPMKYSMLQNGFKLLQCQQLLINLSLFIYFPLPCLLQGVFLHLWLFPAPSPHHLPLLSHDQQTSCSGICEFVFLYLSFCTH